MIYYVHTRFCHEFLGFDDSTSTAEAYSGISSIGFLRCRLSDFHGAYPIILIHIEYPIHQ